MLATREFLMKRRKIRLSDFVIERGGHFTYDFKKLMKLSDEEFIDAHDEEMQGYIKNHLKFTEHYPRCRRCGMGISNPKKLIRYYGANLHGGCFITEYWTENYPEMKKEHELYFDRMLRLIANN
jgi:hypothetical protein